MRTSSAAVVTARPDRYGKQLAAHIGPHVTATWDDGGRRGDDVFDFGTANLDCSTR